MEWREALPRAALLLALPPLALAACGPDRLAGELTLEQSRQRMQACNRILREEGFDEVLQIPGTGSVERVAWEALGPAKQRRLAELSACLRSSGQVEPLTVEFYIPGRTLARIDAANDIDFAAE